MKPKPFFPLSVIVVIAGLLAACAGPAATPPTPARPTAAENATPTTAPPPPAGDPNTAPTAAGTQPPAALAPTCSAPAALTPAQTEGPYFTANSPERSVLFETGMTGTRLVLEGYVLTPGCEPLPGARVDFWQADAEGVYDNQGFRLRGHQITQADGSYRLETVLPGEYPGRPPHIHVKVTPQGGAELTTQVYFPGAASNESDRFFDPGLLVAVTEENPLQARFDFVVDAPASP